MVEVEVLDHKIQQNALLGLFKDKRMAHSLMFIGPRGVGKSLIARKLAAVLLCHSSKELSARIEIFNGCGSCESCLMARAGSHPDLYFIDCAEKITVASVRELLSAIQLKSFSGGARVVILNDADQLSISAVNILLKTLEEPLQNTYFILVLENSAKLPETVQSRCQKWFFGSLSDKTMLALIKEKHGLAGEKAALLADLSGGTLFGLADLIDHVEQYDNFKQRLGRILKGDLKEAIDLASDIHKEKESLDISLRILFSIARQAMKASSQARTAHELSRFVANLMQAQSYIKDRNINSFYILRLVFEDLLLGIQGKGSSRAELQEILV